MTRRPRNAWPQAEVFDFQREIRRSRQRRLVKSLKLAAFGLIGGVALGGAIIAWPTVSSALVRPFDNQASTQHFAVCGIVGRTCVIDGDTFRLNGVKIRIADIDTPELKGRCEWEIDKAEEARNRLAVLLSDGPFDLSPIGDRDEDQYGRKLRIVIRNGSSIGDQLVSEGLARTWAGRREPWC